MVMAGGGGGGVRCVEKSSRCRSCDGSVDNSK